MTTPLTDEVRSALEATLVVAEEQFRTAEARMAKYGKLYDDALAEAEAADQTASALRAVLNSQESHEPDKFKTYGEG
jgi:hypothetical protein